MGWVNPSWAPRLISLDFQVSWKKNQKTNSQMGQKGIPYGGVFHMLYQEESKNRYF